MPRVLEKSEIARRMTEWRNLKILHAKARARVVSLEALLAEKNILLETKDHRITELETALLNKESQRKELAAKLWKARKDRSNDTMAVTGDLTSLAAAHPVKRLPGAQPGRTSAHRLTPSPETVTDRQVFDLSVCPACKHQVGEVVDKVEKYQEDIDLAPRNKIVRHYTITRHWCPGCQEYVRPVNTPAQHLRRFGPNVVGYILYARYRLRLPLLMIRESLSDLHGFEISEGEIVAQLNDARESFGEQYDLICELIRTAHVVYADESGWRMDGDNWYIWAFVSPEDGAVRYEVVDTRGGDTARNALVDPVREKAGEYANRVIVSDGYAIYNNIPGSNQQCWVHLLRVAKAKSMVVYGDLCKLYHVLLLELEKPLTERTDMDKQKLREQLRTIRDQDYNKNKRTGKPFRDPPEPFAPEIQSRITKHYDQLLVCLDYDNVLPENNTAERAIRPQVILRKIFGGNRSPTGAKTHSVNTSVIETKLKQNPGKSFFDVILPLIQEAQKTQSCEQPGWRLIARGGE